MTRRDPDGKAPGALAPERAIGLADAIGIFTRNGAAALRLEEETGSIEPGKSADLILLDRDLFQIPPEQISDTQVLETVFEGRVVSSRDARLTGSLLHGRGRPQMGGSAFRGGSFPAGVGGTSLPGPKMSA